MNKHLSLMTTLLLCAVSTAQPQADPPADPANDAAGVAIRLLDQKLSDKTFELRYQIVNDSGDDIWICAGMEGHCCEAHLTRDNETFLVQRRFDLRPEVLMGTNPVARYARLRKGEARTELMSFALPIRPEYVFTMWRQRRNTLEYATRAVLEIGYYCGDLPEVIFSILHEAERAPKEYPRSLPIEEYDPSYFLGKTTQGFLDLNNEGRGSKSEWLLIPYNWGTLKGEHILRLTTEGIRVPYLEQDRRVVRPDMAKWGRIDMRFRTSPLAFFFPYESEQDLLSVEERQYLQSVSTLVVDDAKLLRRLSDELKKGSRDAFVWENGVAELTWYCGDEHPISLAAYNGSEIVTSHGQVLTYEYPQGLRSLAGVTREIHLLDLRVQCASNLHDLWYRCRLFQRVQSATTLGRQGQHEDSYPLPSDWCDATSSAYWRLEKDELLRAYGCPSAAKGKCHYAMNPNCRYDSPGDMVLLFEMKGGWNQHGGPELFRFENHDPRGGCVLLNDGTVKFIRTKEELRQLRWK